MKTYIIVAILAIISPFMYTLLGDLISGPKIETIEEKIQSVETLLKNTLEKNYQIYRQSDIGTTEFYASKTWKEPNGKDLFLLVPGAHSSFGIWSRRVTVRNGINVGSMLPFVQKSYGLGFDTIIVQPKERLATYLDPVLENILMETNKTIHIAAHSFGGLCVMQSITTNDTFRERIGTINFLDSVHAIEPYPLQKYLKDNVLNWAASDLPLGVPIQQENIDVKPNYMRWLSAGHEIHEYTPHSALDSIFLQLSSLKD